MIRRNDLFADFHKVSVLVLLVFLEVHALLLGDLQLKRVQGNDIVVTAVICFWNLLVLLFNCFSLQFNDNHGINVHNWRLNLFGSASTTLDDLR